MKLRLFEQDQKTETLAAGYVVFREGDTGEEMFAVVDGSVDIVIRGLVVEAMHAGDVFGEMSLIEELPRAATAVVSFEAKVVRIDKKRFLFLVQQNPFFALQMMAILAERLRRTNGRL